MRFIFKTNYDQDLRLFKHGGQVFWYGLLVRRCCSPRRCVAERVRDVAAAFHPASIRSSASG